MIYNRPEIMHSRPEVIHAHQTAPTQFVEPPKCGWQWCVIKLGVPACRS